MSDFCAFCCREQIGDVYGEESIEMNNFEEIIAYLEDLADNTNLQPALKFNEEDAIELELDLEKGYDDEEGEFDDDDDGAK